jgi:hypothetical protein
MVLRVYYAYSSNRKHELGISITLSRPLHSRLLLNIPLGSFDPNTHSD